MIQKYISPFTDYGFKRLFGEEPHKDLLLDFLNELLKDEQGKITEITYLKTEHLGSAETDRKAIFDLYCENEKGEKFIVELQKTKQNFFKDRALYYSTFPIQQQAKRGDSWDYELKAVYLIALLDFCFDEDKKETDKYKYVVKLNDVDTNKVFYDKLTFVYLEIPKFKKTLEELETRFDKWLYLLKNLPKLEQIPEKFHEKVFEHLFEIAEIAKFNREQFESYQSSLKYYWDLKNSFDTARADGRAEGLEAGREEGRQEGRQEGREEGRQEGIETAKKEMALEMLADGEPLEKIARYCKLSIEDIQQLKDNQ